METLATIDAVPRTPFENITLIPANVRTNLNFFQQNPLFLHGRPNEAANPLTTDVANHLVRNTPDFTVTHFTITQAAEVRQAILDQLIGVR